MTVQILQPWNGYQPGIYDLPSATEAQLIALGPLIARDYYVGKDGSNPDHIQFHPIDAAEIATTTGVLGRAYQINDGDDEGAKLIWTATTANPTPSWRWWLWPDAEYL